MAEIILDLSGQAGLADNYYGDMDTITPRPELRVAKKETDLVSGYFNPYLRMGYLAPVSTTSVPVTTNTTPTTQLGCVEYDYINEDIIWGDRLNGIYIQDDLNDTSITFVDDLVSTVAVNKKYEQLHDLQMYMINGVSKLFHVGKGMPTGDGPVTTIATTPIADSYITAGMSMIPFASTKPAVVGTSVRNFTSAAATTTTQAMTVPAGTNRVLVVVAMWTSNASAPTCTWNGTSMTTEATSTLGPSTRVFKLANPTATTANIVVTWGASVADRLVYGFVTDNTEQTTMMDADTTRGTSGSSASTSVTVQIPFTDQNALNLFAAYSNDIMTASVTNGSSLFNTTNTFGSDMLEYRNETGYGLQVGQAALPVTGVGGQSGSWLQSQAVGGFYQDLASDYAFMKVADNGFAYIFADNHVHKVDGTTTGGADGTVTKDVLLFPSNFTITDAIDYRSRLYMAIHQYPVTVSATTAKTYNGKCGLYIWNRISTKLSSADYIELPGVREIKKVYASPDGQLNLVTISDAGQTQLRQFGYNDSGGVVFPVIKTLGVGAFPQLPDGLTTAGDKVMWIANDGDVYSEKENYVTKLFQIKAPGTSTTTMMSNIKTGAAFYGAGSETSGTGLRNNKQALTFSYLDGSTNFVKKIYPFDLKLGSDSTQASGQGDVYTAVNYIPVTSVLRNVRVYNVPVAGTGTTVIATVKLYFNQSSTVGMTKTVTKDEAKRGYVDFKINKPYVHSVQLEVEWSTSITLDGDIYLPSVAVITHDETKTQSPDNG